MGRQRKVEEDTAAPSATAAVLESPARCAGGPEAVGGGATVAAGSSHIVVAAHGKAAIGSRRSSGRA
jgi:hypothetical protein